jgi:hypothetical protein
MPSRGPSKNNEEFRFDDCFARTITARGVACLHACPHGGETGTSVRGGNFTNLLVEAFIEVSDKNNKEVFLFPLVAELQRRAQEQTYPTLSSTLRDCAAFMSGLLEPAKRTYPSYYYWPRCCDLLFFTLCRGDEFHADGKAAAMLAARQSGPVRLVYPFN